MTASRHSGGSAAGGNGSWAVGISSSPTQSAWKHLFRPQIITCIYLDHHCRPSQSPGDCILYILSGHDIISRWPQEEERDEHIRPIGVLLIFYYCPLINIRLGSSSHLQTLDKENHPERPGRDRRVMEILTLTRDGHSSIDT